jgi:hypothetical protein
MDLRGEGLLRSDPARLQRIGDYLARRYQARISFDDTSPFGRIDEIRGTIHLNPATATYDVLAHELSHLRFAWTMGKWGNDLRLSNFEVNLMEAIGYYGTYRKGLSVGLSVPDALANASLGPAMAQSAIQAIRSRSPAAMLSLGKAVAFYGKLYVELALRFDGKGLGLHKLLSLT